MTWSAARAALDTKMATLSGSPVIVYPGMPAANQTALHHVISFLPATVEPELAGGNHERGIYQVSVYAPAALGLGAALTAADAVVALFARQNLSGVSCGVPSLGPPMQEPDWVHLPVSIPFTVL